MSSKVQFSTMAPALPFDIIALIIDIVGGNNDTDLLKELSLVSSIFLPICSKHLFADIGLNDGRCLNPKRSAGSSKKGFIKLLKSRPDVVKHVRKLSYVLEINDRFQSPQLSRLVDDDDLLSPILPQSLRTIPHLNSLEIYASNLDWNTLDSCLTSAFLHLMQLPSINRIDLTCINNFPLSGLTSCVNLLRLDIFQMEFVGRAKEEVSPALVVQSEIMPKIRQLYTSEAFFLMAKLLLAKMQDGRPAFRFQNLQLLSISITQIEEKRIFQYLLLHARCLVKLILSMARDQTLAGLRVILFPRARTLKVLEMNVYLYSRGSVRLPLGGLCEELKGMAGNNILEVLSVEVYVGLHDTEDFIGPIIQNMERVLVNPGWPALRKVTIIVSCPDKAEPEDGAKFTEALKSLPDKYLTHLSKLENIAFDYITDWTH